MGLLRVPRQRVPRAGHRNVDRLALYLRERRAEDLTRGRGLVPDRRLQVVRCSRSMVGERHAATPACVRPHVRLKAIPLPFEVHPLRLAGIRRHEESNLRPGENVLLAIACWRAVGPDGRHAIRLPLGQWERGASERKKAVVRGRNVPSRLFLVIIPPQGVHGVRCHACSWSPVVLLLAGSVRESFAGGPTSSSRVGSEWNNYFFGGLKRVTLRLGI